MVSHLDIRNGNSVFQASCIMRIVYTLSVFDSGNTDSVYLVLLERGDMTNRAILTEDDLMIFCRTRSENNQIVPYI